MSEVTNIDKNEDHDNTADNIAPKPLIVNEEYASLVPQISEQEYQTIRQSIKDNGQWVPIITNPQLIILNGHTRFRACKELDLDPRIMIRKFEDPLLEKQFIIQINRNRRQLTSFQRIELEYKYQTIQSELAKKRMSEAGKTGAGKRWKKEREIDVSKKSVSEEDRVVQNNTTPSNAQELAEETKVKGKVIEISAKNAQVSPATYNKGIKIIKSAASQEILNKLRIGEVSIHKAYGQLTKQKPLAATQDGQQIAATQERKSVVTNETSSDTEASISRTDESDSEKCPNCSELEEALRKVTTLSTADTLYSTAEILDLEFSLPYQSVQQYMAAEYQRGKSKVWFSVEIDVKAKKVTSGRPGRISEEAS